MSSVTVLTRKPTNGTQMQIVAELKGIFQRSWNWETQITLNAKREFTLIPPTSKLTSTRAQITNDECYFESLYCFTAGILSWKTTFPEPLAPTWIQRPRLAQWLGIGLRAGVRDKLKYWQKV